MTEGERGSYQGLPSCFQGGSEFTTEIAGIELNQPNLEERRPSEPNYCIMDPVIISPPPSRQSSSYKPAPRIRTDTLTIPGIRTRKESNSSVRKISHGSEILFVEDRNYGFIQGPGRELIEEDYKTSANQLQDTHCSCSLNHQEVSPERSVKEEETQNNQVQFDKNKFSYRLVASLAVTLFFIILVIGEIVFLSLKV